MSKSICPLCGQANNCAMELGKEPSSCWCMDIKMPEGILDMVSDEDKNKGCICKNCIMKYKEQLNE